MLENILTTGSGWKTCGVLELARKPLESAGVKCRESRTLLAALLVLSSSLISWEQDFDSSLRYLHVRYVSVPVLTDHFHGAGKHVLRHLNRSWSPWSGERASESCRGPMRQVWGGSSSVVWCLVWILNVRGCLTQINPDRTSVSK